MEVCVDSVQSAINAEKGGREAFSYTQTATLEQERIELSSAATYSKGERLQQSVHPDVPSVSKRDRALFRKALSERSNGT